MLKIYTANKTSLIASERKHPNWINLNAQIIMRYYLIVFVLFAIVNKYISK